MVLSFRVPSMGKILIKYEYLIIYKRMQKSDGTTAENLNIKKQYMQFPNL